MSAEVEYVKNLNQGKRQNAKKGLAIFERGYLGAIFSGFIRHGKWLEKLYSMYKSGPTQYIFFPIAALLSVGTTLISWYDFIVSKNKNSRKTTNIAVETVSASLIVTAVAGSLFLPVVFATLTPILFTVALGLGALNSLVAVTRSIHKLRTVEDPAIRDRYKVDLRDSLIGLVTLAAITVGLGLMLIAGIAPMAMAILCTAAATTGAVATLGIAISDYRKHKENASNVPAIPRVKAKPIKGGTDARLLADTEAKKQAEKHKENASNASAIPTVKAKSGNWGIDPLVLDNTETEKQAEKQKEINKQKDFYYRQNRKAKLLTLEKHSEPPVDPKASSGGQTSSFNLNKPPADLPNEEQAGFFNPSEKQAFLAPEASHISHSDDASGGGFPTGEESNMAPNDSQQELLGNQSSQEEETDKAQKVTSGNQQQNYLINEALAKIQALQDQTDNEKGFFASFQKSKRQAKVKALQGLLTMLSMQGGEDNSNFELSSEDQLIIKKAEPIQQQDFSGAEVGNFKTMFNLFELRGCAGKAFQSFGKETSDTQDIFEAAEAYFSPREDFDKLYRLSTRAG